MSNFTFVTKALFSFLLQVVLIRYLIMKSKLSKKYFLLLIYILTVFPCFSYTNPHVDEIIVALTNKGYENLYVTVSQDTIYIAYENRKYRWSCKAMIDIIRTVIPLSENSKKLCLVTQVNGIPILQIIFNIDKYNDFISGKISQEDFGNSIHASFDIGDFQRQLKYLNRNNSSFNKVDIVIHPQIRAQFGNYSDPVESRINIAPAINVSFWKGMNLTTQVIFPLQNDLGKEGNYIRPGLLTINQLIKLPSSSFASITAGYFTNNRYGINLELNKFFLEGKFAFGANLGYTSHASVLDGRWNYSEVELFSWFTDIAYRNATYDLTLKFGYGSFINKDKGWRFDMYRQFGEICIGFYGMKTNGVLNGGFNFIIPIPPRKYNSKRMIRVRPASYFAWEYRAKGLPDEGKSYDTGSDQDKLLMFYNPDYIKNEIVKQIIIYK